MEKRWWKEAVVYQVYPRSFYDSNGDGIGDIRGIISKLDYIRSIGIDVVWLCPVYKSPNDDNGYDISDYYDIMSEFGTMADFEDLLEEAHKKGLKIIMDLVVNHTSDEHPWFIESRTSKNSEKRDYYIWRKGKNGKEPNNWGSHFSPSAWEYDEKTDEYYLHLFSKKQPDLNWRNPKLREEIYRMMTWWLDKGIDGFRMDAINMIGKDDEFPDSQKPATTIDGYVFDTEMYTNNPIVHKYLKEMNEKVFSKYDVMTVGETARVTPEIALEYAGNGRNELDTVFQFEMSKLGRSKGDPLASNPLKISELKEVITKWQTSLHGRGWNCNFLGNHDQIRAVSHWGNDKEFRVQSAKLLATMLLTLEGTPYIYQGEEIGMTNVEFKSIDECMDIDSINYYNEWVNKRKWDPKVVMKAINARGRDNARTPMQWSEDKNAGFTAGKPWIKVNPNYCQINVEREENNPDSILNYYRKMIKIRKENHVLIYGRYEPVLKEDEAIFAYTMSLDKDRMLIILNFAGSISEFELPEQVDFNESELLISNYTVLPGDMPNHIELKPYEARVYRLI